MYTLHHITLHYITYMYTLHHITLHYITYMYTLHHITLHYITNICIYNYICIWYCNSICNTSTPSFRWLPGIPQIQAAVHVASPPVSTHSRCPRTRRRRWWRPTNGTGRCQGVGRGSRVGLVGFQLPPLITGGYPLVI